MSLQNRSGETPLDIAVHKGSPKFLKTLLGICTPPSNLLLSGFLPTEYRSKVSLDTSRLIHQFFGEQSHPNHIYKALSIKNSQGKTPIEVAQTLPLPEVAFLEENPKYKRKKLIKKLMKSSKTADRIFQILYMGLQCYNLCSIRILT